MMLKKVYLEIGNVCNRSCAFCPGTVRKAKQMSVSEFRHAAEQAKTVSDFVYFHLMGEPLLHPEAVYAIHRAAKACGVPRRQVITNGYFSRNEAYIREVAGRLANCGVNDVLLSVDAFHQETIPLEIVRIFAREMKKIGVPFRLQPAWLVSREDENPYNQKTREILRSFQDMNPEESEGNVIFPEGNALIYLSDYFVSERPENPYCEDPCDVRCISFDASGDVLDGNVYKRDILEILEQYKP